jgi:uncharacterized protein (DUF302 family)
MRYFGFAVADSMFSGNVTVRRTVNVNLAGFFATDVISCCNPSHAATLAAAKSRFGIDLPIPESPPKVALTSGDELLVMSVRGLPRLTDRREYTEEEIARAEFEFAHWQVV